MLGGIDWRAALAGYWAGSTGQPLASRSGGILGGMHWSSSGGILSGIHWRAALAGYRVGAWCRSIANADSNIKSNNPFLPGGEKNKTPRPPAFGCHRRHARPAAHEDALADAEAWQEFSSGAAVCQGIPFMWVVLFVLFLTYCGWTKSCNKLNHTKPLFVGIYRGIIIPGFLRWCRISSIHSTVPPTTTTKRLVSPWFPLRNKHPQKGWPQKRHTR